MKRILVLVLLVGLASVLFAEDAVSGDTNNYNPQTLFGGKEFTFGGYGGPIVAGSLIGDRVFLITGGEGGCIINHSIIIGGAGKGIVTPIPGKDTNISVRLGWGGLMLGYVFMPETLVHPYVKTVLGAGGVVESMDQDRHYMSDANANAFFAAELETGVEVNVVSWFKTAAFVGYHYLYGDFTVAGLKDADLRGFDFGLKFEFGYF
jgi:hypothetical protein